MPALTPTKTGAFKSRQRIPKDVADEYGRLYGQRHETKLFVPAGTTQHEAKQLYGEWIAEHAGRVKSIRAARDGTGLDLTEREARALAGDWYNWFVARHENAPGKPEHWDIGFWQLVSAMEEYAPDEVREQPWSDLEWTRDPDVRSGMRPELADLGHTAQFLGTRGIALTLLAQAQFLDCVLDNYIAALLLLGRRAKGDYSPDELPMTFPAFVVGKIKSQTTGLTPRELFDGWIQARQPKQSSIESWSTVFNALTRQFPDHGADAITPEQAQAWLDGLVTEKRSAFTVRNTWLRAVKAVYSWGKRRKLIAANVFAEARVDVPRRKRHRPKWFYENEYKAILKAASETTDNASPDKAAQRWVPWIQAYTGARPSEVTQLRVEDVEHVDGVWSINLTPGAGTIKTNEARRVPLHEHLIEQGFLGFVDRKRAGPLFYSPRRGGKAGSDDPTKQKKSPAAQARQRLATWVGGSVGVKAKGLSPNHAWRHTFKLLGGRAELTERILDYICGHAPATEGRGYGEPTLGDTAAALKKFPRYEA